MCLESTLSHFIVECPATCELCAQWLPNHASGCPRKGVHPSQWTLDPTLDVTEETYQLELDQCSEDEC
ncbi:hypothetical protein INT44_003602 [Umbelopsis vinacea]|uniref:Uncharacterized protein n=1 Tax=Umbelopsis vinacea TaxID=44442 RepID=A0A8H7PVG1_9FUNG|nr:hypothetical protein INT44_003602 [Umbelopsis vinacea]KAI9288932.1 hypothetical protein BC943DRAFT_272533 [Umbelopsis sp. AD052]